jgi:hypothetical protein
MKMTVAVNKTSTSNDSFLSSTPIQFDLVPPHDDIVDVAPNLQGPPKLVCNSNFFSSLCQRQCELFHPVIFKVFNLVKKPSLMTFS